MWLRRRKESEREQNDTHNVQVPTFVQMEKTLTFSEQQVRHVVIGVSSIIGGRAYQQDAVDVVTNEKNVTLAVVCDGMGGMEDGGRASSLCVEQVCADFKEHAEQEYMLFYLKEIHKLDEAVAGLKDETGKTVKAGTTFVSVVIDGNALSWASVGDSRIYLIRGDEIVQITKDHNYALLLKEKVKSCEMTQEMADRQEKKEALISFIGLGNISWIDVNQKPFLLEEGDYVLLCSDGLYKAIDDQMLLQTVKLYGEDVSETAEVLTSMAEYIGGQRQDNTTVVLMRYQG